MERDLVNPENARAQETRLKSKLEGSKDYVNTSLPLRVCTVKGVGTFRKFSVATRICGRLLINTYS